VGQGAQRRAHVFLFGATTWARRFRGFAHPTEKKTGCTFETEWVHVFTIRDTKVTRFREHADTAQFAEGYRA
jgi:ketosteroid isomerase-like protein